MAKQLLVGVAKSEITPSGSVPMAGYMARTGCSLGVHDPLWARCFVFQYGQEQGCLIILDLLGIHEYWANEIKFQVAATTNLLPEKVAVTCTHTHSGPAGFDTPPSAEKTMLSVIEKTFINIKFAVKKAIQNMCPVQVGVGTITVTGIAGHRIDPGRIVDQTLWGVTFWEAGDNLKGVLANFPVHSTVLGPENRFLSGDLLGTAAARAEYLLGGNTVVALTCGAAGDISTRFFRQRQDFAELERLGKILSDAIVRLVHQISITGSADFAMRRRQCWLPYRPSPPIEEVQRIIAERQAELAALMRRPNITSGELRIVQTQIEGAKLLLDLVQRGIFASGGVQTSLVGVRIGNGIIVGVPGEPFNMLAKIVRGFTPAGFHSAVMGLTDGYSGYFPDQEAIEKGWYEALASPFDHRALVVLGKETQKLLQELCTNIQASRLLSK